MESIKNDLQKILESPVMSFDPATIVQRGSLFFLQIQQTISKVTSLQDTLKKVEASVAENRRMLRQLLKKS